MFSALDSIKWRLVITYVIIVAIAITVLGLYLIRQLESYALAQMKENLRQNTLYVARLVVDKNIDYENTHQWQDLVREWGEIAQARVTLIARDGEVIADSDYDFVEKMENHGDRIEVIEALENSWGEEQRYSNTLKKNMYYVAQTWEKDSQVFGIARLALPLTEILNMVQRLKNMVYIAIVFAIIITIISSVIVAAHLTRPLELLSEAANKVSTGGLGQTIKIRASGEINTLVDSFNKMSSELKHKVNSIDESRAQMQTIITTMVSGLLFIDNRGVIMLANPAAKRLLQIEQAEQKHYTAVARNSKLFNLIERCLRDKIDSKKEIEIISRDEIHNVEAILSPLIDNQGNGQGIIVLLHDVSEARRVEQSRRDLIANVSHELRTPVTAIKGFTETLLQGAQSDPKDREEFLCIIDHESSRLAKLIEDLLQLAKLDAGQLPIHPKMTDVSSTIESVYRTFKAKSKEKGVRLENNINSIPLLCVDELRFEQVLTNLLENALKFTPPGGLIQILACEDKEEVVLSVKDSGIGIAHEQVGRIFERFYRADRGRVRSSGGTGLGLAIVKHLVDAHKGYLTVSSNLSEGTTINVHLPKIESI